MFNSHSGCCHFHAILFHPLSFSSSSRFFMYLLLERMSIEAIFSGQFSLDWDLGEGVVLGSNSSINPSSNFFFFSETTRFLIAGL